MRIVVQEGRPDTHATVSGRHDGVQDGRERCLSRSPMKASA